MSEAFELHPRLEADTALVRDLALSRALLMKDANYPWLILVPRLKDVADLDGLSEDDLARLFREARRASHALKRLFRPDRVNVAALGNMVPQLHVHVIARFEGDPAWPGPVWGAAPPKPYDAQALAERVQRLRSELG
jgi:diadenosine tetraphosphate (Ap4A) HIT family hydrolase